MTGPCCVLAQIACSSLNIDEQAMKKNLANAAGSEVMPVWPPFIFIMRLTCFMTWSMPMLQKGIMLLYTQKLPHWNSSHMSGSDV